MLKILKKKSKGISDLIVSLIAITGLITVSVIMISLMADVYTRTQLDQVARKYILQLEAADIKDYTATIAGIRSDLWRIPAVADTSAFGKTPNDIKVHITPAAGSRKYGDEIVLELEVPMSRTNFFYFTSNDGKATKDKAVDEGVEGSETNGSFGKIRRNVYSVATVRKQTTVKY